MKQIAAAIEIGTGKLVCMIAQSGAADGFNLLGTAVTAYSGYNKKGWIEPKELRYAFGSVISEAEKQAGQKIRYVHVGVPADFTEVICRKVSLNFNKNKRISQEDIDLLFKRGENFSLLRSCLIAHRCPIQFTIDGERRTMNPIGVYASEIEATVSYVLVDKAFAQSVSSLLDSLGYQVDTFISPTLAQALAFIPEDMRDRTAVLVDIGYRSTAITVLKGDGILYHKTVPVGGAHITRDLAITMHIEDDIAQQLKHRTVYGLSIGKDDKYEIMMKETYKILRFPAARVHEIVNARVEEICQVIKRTLQNCGCILPEYVSIYLTGGTSNMRGIREFAQKEIGRSVTLIQPKATKMNKPEFSAALGTIDYASESVSEEEPTLWEHIKMIFKGSNNS